MIAPVVAAMSFCALFPRAARGGNNRVDIPHRLYGGALAGAGGFTCAAQARTVARTVLPRAVVSLLRADGSRGGRPCAFPGFFSQLGAGLPVSRERRPQAGRQVNHQNSALKKSWSGNGARLPDRGGAVAGNVRRVLPEAVPCAR